MIFYTNYDKISTLFNQLNLLIMENNYNLFVTVLKNISKNTPVEIEAQNLINGMNFNKAGIKTDEVWKAEAYKTFYELLQSEIDLMQKLQNDCINSIFFQLENK